MRLKIFYAFTLFFIAIQAALAQQVTVTGTVKDAQGEPILGAYVLVKGTPKGTTTNDKGAYKIEAKAGDVQEIDTGLVFTGYGAPKVASRTVASVEQVQGKDIAEVPTANIADALQGRIAGLVINARNRSGRAGGNSDIVIHGYNNFIDLFDKDRAASAPLIIMDGVAVSAGVLSDFNSADIENITILKDAASTSIYGSRAANGVILITTKRGKKNEKTNVTISHQVGFSALTSASRKFFDDLMTPREYMDYWIARNPANVRAAARVSGSTEADTRAAAEKLLAENPYNTRWDKIFFRDFVPLTRTDVSISGGTNSTSYHLSLGYFNQEGTTYPADNYKRYTLNGSIDTDITPWLKAGISFAVGHNEREGSSSPSMGTSRTTVLPLYSPKNTSATLIETLPRASITLTIMQPSTQTIP